ncbi:Scarecrow-like transcription factor pat1 [Thalictrum thalictroides]|uniref:Scarecrow-like transcription factor pat1 n=1 Tax=Thalictrum thalictroides TaxID=46969 RepID=A0A7J6VBP2_THATH|nr:Scarecrow-like transcription factor pat1 [Thalictrum thalictroides]
MKDDEGKDEVQEELLDLNLAVKPYSCKDKKKRKMKNNNAGSSTHMKPHELKIYELLQMREQMLRLDPMKQGVVEDRKGLHLIHLLLVSATAVDDNNIQSATENLCQLYQLVSLSGDSVQRVAAYFADGLSARFITRKSPFYDMIIKDPTPDEEFLAFTELYKASPYYQFAHFTANQEIIEAFEAEEEQNDRSLHVIDFDISYGFQWPSLIQSLSEKATRGNRICLRITGFGRSLEELVATEVRLVNFASSCNNLTFEFLGKLRGSEEINSRKKKNETVVVNLVLHLHTLTNSTQISNTLISVNSFGPSIVILVEKETSRSLRSFLSRFMESLHYFAAMFDSLEDCLLPESAERLCIEKNLLGKEIKKMMNYDKDEDNYQRLETWKGRMESNGFVAKKLSSRSVIQAKLLLKIRSHTSPFTILGRGSGFRILERDEGCALSLGWQDRFLITASTWKCM